MATVPEPAAASRRHRDEETQGLEKVTDYVEEVENAPELGQVSEDHNFVAFLWL